MTEKAINPFVGVNADAMAAIGTLLKFARRSDDYDTFYDEINEMIASWRAARGDDAFDHWHWWIGEVDGPYGLDFSTREEAIAAAPAAIRDGYPHSEDGRFNIVEARFWNDDIHPEDDEYPFAETRNAETLSIKVQP